jgi:aminoglycoside phosphotransferase (APT) family kinase protein
MNPRTAVRFESNFEALRTLAARSGHSETPQPLLAGNIKGTVFFAETMLPGTAVREHLTRKSADAAMSGAATWICDLHLSTAAPRRLSAADVATLVEGPLARAFAFVGRTPSDRVHLEVHHYLRRAFLDQLVPLVQAHGDYSVDNVLVAEDGARVTGVFDWDLADQPSLPLLDTVYLILSRRLAQRRGTFSQQVAHMLTRRQNSPSDEGLLDEYCRALEIPGELRKPLVVMTWVNHLARRIQGAESYRWPHHQAEFESGLLEALLTTARA